MVAPRFGGFGCGGAVLRGVEKPIGQSAVTFRSGKGLCCPSSS
jgi:hypothetical protein